MVEDVGEEGASGTGFRQGFLLGLILTLIANGVMVYVPNPLGAKTLAESLKNVLIYLHLAWGLSILLSVRFPVSRYSVGLLSGFNIANDLVYVLVTGGALPA